MRLHSKTYDFGVEYDVNGLARSFRSGAIYVQTMSTKRLHAKGALRGKESSVQLEHVQEKCANPCRRRCHHTKLRAK